MLQAAPAAKQPAAVTSTDDKEDAEEAPKDDGVSVLESENANLEIMM